MRRGVWILGAAASAFCAAVSAWSCSQGTLPEEPVRAVDASTAQDSSRLDAGFDVREVSVPEPPGEFDIPGEWDKVAGAPVECPTWVLRDPAAIPPLPWKACSNGRADCRSFSADWEERGVVRAFFPVANDPSYEAPEGVYVAYARGARVHSKLRYWVLQNLEGKARAAFAVQVSACASTFGANGYGFAMGVHSPAEGSFVAFAPPAAPASIAFTKAAVEPSLDGFIGTTPIANGILVEQSAFGSRNHAARFDLQTKTFYGPGILSEQPVKLGEGFIALMATSPPVIAYVPPAGGYQPLRRAAPGHQFFTLTVDHDTSAIVWAEDDGNENMTIWTSPAATTEAAMQPRQVAKLRFVSKIVARNGVIAIRPNEGLGRLIRLSDGMGWDLPTDNGLEVANPLWLNEEAVWFEASRRYSGGFPFNSGIRYARNALGPPTVPSGL